MKFIALDLEMEQPSRQIISVGLAYYDGNSFDIANFMITPEYHVSEFISKLTGIVDSDFDHDKPRHDCFNDVLEWVNSKEVDISSFIVWGKGDVGALNKDMWKNHGLWFKDMSSDKFVDVKTLYLMEYLIQRNKWQEKVSLSTACRQSSITVDANKTHNSGYDAFLTASLFFKMFWIGQSRIRHASSLSDTITYLK